MRFLRYCNNHPNVVKYLRSYLVADEVWLLTEYMQGGTLTQAVAVHQFTEPEIAFIAKQVPVLLSQIIYHYFILFVTF
jgi:p21-activated kinase 1